MKLSIAYINDVHGYLEPHPELFYHGGEEFTQKAGGYSRIASVVNDIRRSNHDTLLFDGGDTFHGTLPVIQSKGEVLVPVLNKMGFAAMVGHWDFAYGPGQLKNLAQQLNYPVLAINVYNKIDNTLFLPPYIFIEVKDLKIAVIGICCNIIDKTMPANFSEGIKVTDGSSELPGYIQKVKEEGADVVILLSHNGFPQDVSLLSKCKGVDICLSAHTHNRLYEAVSVNDCIVIQCGCHGSFVGNLELQIEEKKIVDYTYKLITVDDSIKSDPEIEQLVNEIISPFQNLKEEPIGKTTSILHRYHTLSSAMDYLLLSAIKSAGEADIAFSNGWRYGAPVPIGTITKWDLFNIIPMNPAVSVVEMTGKEIIKMLEENLERTFSENPMEQMGGYVKRCLGLYVKMRIENPKGNRIQEIYFGKEHLKKDKNFKVAFVTTQGVPEKYGTQRKELKIKSVQAMELFLKQNPDFMHIPGDTFCLV